MKHASRITQHLLEITVFICGAVVMIFELAGSRVLGPYFGTSIFVWTSIIGIILGSLSLGYYYGGRLADKRPTQHQLAFIILLSALAIGSTLIFKDVLLLFLQLAISDVRMSTVLAATILFLPASFLLGIVSPYAVKLKLGNLETSGATVGNLYALSTAGSIIGTFLAGFYLIPHFGTNKLLLILCVILVLLSLMLSEKKYWANKIFFLILLLLTFPLLGRLTATLGERGLVDVDTAYNRVFIFDYTEKETGRRAKVMGINSENHSSMFLDGDELVNEYTKYYHLARHFFPNFRTTLMLGGAGYSYPKDFLRSYATATIDVIEIDPQMTALAKQYFRLEENPRLRIMHEDGRVFLNRSTSTYDVIFGDAFSSHYSVPYQLTTQEATQRKHDILSRDGIVILNIISSVHGDKGRFLRAEYATYKSVFPQVYLFPVTDPADEDLVQNIILVALKTKEVPPFVSADPVLHSYLTHRLPHEVVADMPILTDDYAPVDYYMWDAI